MASDEDGTLHVIQKSDTLAGLSLRYGVSVPELCRANRVAPASKNMLLLMKTIRIPRTATATSNGGGATAQSESPSPSIAPSAISSTASSASSSISTPPSQRRDAAAAAAAAVEQTTPLGTTPEEARPTSLRGFLDAAKSKLQQSEVQVKQARSSWSTTSAMRCGQCGATITIEPAGVGERVCSCGKTIEIARKHTTYQAVADAATVVVAPISHANELREDSMFEL